MNIMITESPATNCPSHPDPGIAPVQTYLLVAFNVSRFVKV